MEFCIYFFTPEICSFMFCCSLLYTAGPVNNILVVRQDLNSNSRPNSQAPSRRHGSFLPPALEKYANPMDEDADVKVVMSLHSSCAKSMDASYSSSLVINNQIKELQVCLVDVDPPLLSCVFVFMSVRWCCMCLFIHFLVAFLIEVA